MIFSFQRADKKRAGFIPLLSMSGYVAGYYFLFAAASILFLFLFF